LVPGSPRLDPIATGRSDCAGEAPTLYKIDGIRFEQCDSLGRTPRWVRSWRYSAASVIADRSVGEVQMRKALLVFGTVLGVYLIARAIAEPFVIDVSDPASYRKDWGGPGLAGVLLVHCGPGVIAAVLLGRAAAADQDLDPLAAVRVDVERYALAARRPQLPALWSMGPSDRPGRRRPRRRPDPGNMLGARTDRNAATRRLKHLAVTACTTVRYGRARKNLDRDPEYILAAYMAFTT